MEKKGGVLQDNLKRKKTWENEATKRHPRKRLKSRKGREQTRNGAGPKWPQTTITQTPHVFLSGLTHRGRNVIQSESITTAQLWGKWAKSKIPYRGFWGQFFVK